MCERRNDAKALGELADDLIAACQTCIVGIPDALGTAFAGVLGEALPDDWEARIAEIDAAPPRRLTYPNI